MKIFQRTKIIMNTIKSFWVTCWLIWNFSKEFYFMLNFHYDIWSRDYNFDRRWLTSIFPTWFELFKFISYNKFICFQLRSDPCNWVQPIPTYLRPVQLIAGKGNWQKQEDRKFEIQVGKMEWKRTKLDSSSKSWKIRN